jgi:hypothetical protein
MRFGGSAPRIDFARRRARSAALCMTILLLAALVAAAAAGRWWHQQHRLAALADGALRAEGAARPAPRSAGVVTPELARSVNDAIRRLNIPWERVFLALNGAALQVPAGSVALLALEPDGSGLSIKLSAEARHAEAMLAYQRALLAQPGVSAAHLTRHEMASVSPQSPLRFSVEMRLKPAQENAG